MSELNSKLDNANRWNDAFDESIKTTNCVTKEQFEMLFDAFENDSASSVQWLISKLRMIKNLISINCKFNLNNSISEIEVDNQTDFKDWITNNFNHFICEQVFE
jgi:hypothetical protein